MKKHVLSTFLAVLFSLLILPTPSRAQIELNCRMAFTTVLQYERVPVDFVALNNTGRPLIIGGPEENARIRFQVESSPGSPVAPTGEPLLKNAIRIGPGETYKGEIDLLPAYKIRSTGPYTIRMQIDWSEQSFVSGKMFLDVVPGLEINKLVAGIPAMPSAMRTYSLRTLNRDRGEHVFLRIDDEGEDKCYGVFDLGRIVRLYHPVMQVDGEGAIHVVHQAGPSQFLHSAFTPYGYSVQRQQYSGTGARIRLESSTTGQISVEGGNARRTAAERSEEDAAEGEMVEFEDLGK